MSSSLDESRLEEGELGTDTDSGSESEETFQRAVLPVAEFSEQFTPESRPRSGEEYLALVRHERQHLPKLVVAHEHDAFQDKEPREKRAKVECEPRFTKDEIARALGEHDLLLSAVSSATPSPDISLVEPCSFDFTQSPDASTLKALRAQYTDGQLLKLLSAAVKTLPNDWALALLAVLDTTLTAHQQSLLRHLAQSVDNAPFTIVVASRFGQRDLLSSDQ